jgi:septum formation topological specificity factor MinE
VTKYQILSTFPKQFNSDILKIIQAYVFQNKAKIKLSIEVGFEDDFSISMRDIC